MKVQLVGCSHHASAVNVRERLAFTPQQVEEALVQLRLRFPQTEAVLLSTCNRVELYTATENASLAPSHHEVAEFMAAYHGLRLFDVFDDLFERTGDDAILHLFTVAAGLDSMVLGEPQILSQVKQAYDLACLRNCAGPLTHSVFQAALRTAKRVTRETEISRKRVSIPSVAVADLACQFFERFDDKRVLVIGAGEMGQETLRYLADVGVCDVVVINRRLERAERLAQEWNGRPAPWERLLDELTEADLVVSTTGADRPIVTLDDYLRVEEARYQRPLFILDLAIPRDFDAAIDEHGLNVYLYSIDDLQQACEHNRKERERELPKAIAIVEEEAAAFMADLNRRATGPIIHRLKQGMQQPKDDELRRLFNKLPELNDRERAEIERSFDRLINKLLHPPLESLRDESQNGSPHALLDALKRLFQLKD